MGSKGKVGPQESGSPLKTGGGHKVLRGRAKKVLDIAAGAQYSGVVFVARFCCVCRKTAKAAE